MAMDSFDPNSRVATSVDAVEIVLRVRAGSPNEYQANYNFFVLDQDGEKLEQREGDLTPHLTNAQKTAAASFMDEMLTKAQGAVSQ